MGLFIGSKFIVVNNPRLNIKMFQALRVTDAASIKSTVEMVVSQLRSNESEI